MALIDERNGKIAVKGKDFGSVEMNGYSFFYIHHQCFIVLKFINFSVSSEREKKGTERGHQSSLLWRFIEAPADLTAFWDA
jgi:hypothetical protein